MNASYSPLFQCEKVEYTFPPFKRKESRQSVIYPVYSPDVCQCKIMLYIFILWIEV